MHLGHFTAAFRLLSKPTFLHQALECLFLSPFCNFTTSCSSAAFPRLRKIANSVRLEGKETEAQLLKANQDTILLRQRAMQESVKALADQMFELRSMITTIPGIVKKRREEDVAGIE